MKAFENRIQEIVAYPRKTARLWQSKILAALLLPPYLVAENSSAVAHHFLRSCAYNDVHADCDIDVQMAFRPFDATSFVLAVAPKPSSFCALHTLSRNSVSDWNPSQGRGVYYVSADYFSLHVRLKTEVRKSFVFVTLGIHDMDCVLCRRKSGETVFF